MAAASAVEIKRAQEAEQQRVVLEQIDARLSRIEALLAPGEPAELIEGAPLATAEQADTLIRMVETLLGRQRGRAA